MRFIAKKQAQQKDLEQKDILVLIGGRELDERKIACGIKRKYLFEGELNSMPTARE
jgi:hypothetical protein